MPPYSWEQAVRTAAHPSPPIILASPQAEAQLCSPGLCQSPVPCLLLWWLLGMGLSPHKAPLSPRAHKRHTRLKEKVMTPQKTSQSPGPVTTLNQKLLHYGATFPFANLSFGSRNKACEAGGSAAPQTVPTWALLAWANPGHLRHHWVARALMRVWGSGMGSALLPGMGPPWCPTMLPSGPAGSCQGMDAPY